MTMKEAGVTPEFFVQFASHQYNCNALAERCVQDFQAKHPSTPIRSCRLYIKPEDGRVYYVINEIEDRLAL